MQKLTSHYDGNDAGYEKIVSFHLTRAQLMVATITLILMLAGAIVKSVWGVSSMSSEVHRDHQELMSQDLRIKRLEEQANETVKLNENILTLNQAVKDLKDEINAERADWDDLWKNYSIPRRR